MFDVFTVAFFGHRQIDDLLEAEESLKREIEKILRVKRYAEFLVGQSGDFDRCVASAVNRTKKEFRDDNSALVLVLPYATAEYQNNEEGYHKFYDEVEISQKAAAAHPKSAFKIRNREMVNRADLVICWIERQEGGAAEAIKYAKSQGKEVLNLYDIK